VKEIALAGPQAKKARALSVTAKNLDKYLGVRRYDFGRAEQENEIGLVTGLAWTEVGGDLLQIESTLVPGKGQLTLTGQLGDVMKESASAALSVVRARAEDRKSVVEGKRGVMRGRGGGRRRGGGVVAEA